MIDIAKLTGIDKQIVLASASPRRKYLLDMLGFKFSIIPADLDEHHIPLPADPAEAVRTLAALKAEKVASQIDFPAIVIGADTTVVFGSNILNKPADAREAVEMLHFLSGKTHTVFTGLTVFDTVNKKEIRDVVATRVTFRDLNSEEIEAYVASGSPLDKAGAYGIQDDFGALFVCKIEGCYYNIVGLPIETLYLNLKKISA